MGYHSAAALSSRNIKMKSDAANKKTETCISRSIILCFVLLVLLVIGCRALAPTIQDRLKEESSTTTPASITKKFKPDWKPFFVSKKFLKKASTTTTPALIIEKYEPSSPIDPIKINIRKKRSSLLPWSFFSRFVTNKLDLMTILVDTEISPPAETETEHQRKRRDLDKTPLLTKPDMNSSTAKNETEVQHQLKHYNLGCNPLLALLTLGFLC